MEILDQLPVILASTIRLSIPLIFCCLAGLFSERSGVVDIGLEGKMLAAAFAAAVAASTYGSDWIGLAAGIVTAIVFSLVHGVSAISYRGNQIVSGVAINMLALGLTALLGNVWYGQGGRTPTVAGDARFQPIDLALVGDLRSIPGIGPLYAEVISGHNILVYLAFACVPLTAWAVYRTRFGLRLRAVGENPAAVDTAGISVSGLRYRAVIVCGVLCGLAGTYLSIAQSAAFVPNMTAGKGFMALAALIFAKWRPWPSLGACLLFGFLDAFAIQMQSKTLPIIGEVPVQLVLALPYILTVVLLAGFIGSANPPRASGVPYVKER
jgi:general nucleoside transport system permease protein